MYGCERGNHLASTPLLATGHSIHHAHRHCSLQPPHNPTPQKGKKLHTNFRENQRQALNKSENWQSKMQKMLWPEIC